MTIEDQALNLALKGVPALYEYGGLVTALLLGLGLSVALNVWLVKIVVGVLRDVTTAMTRVATLIEGLKK